MTAILGTASDGSPTLELATPKGQKRWVYGYSEKGPVPIEVPKRKKQDGDTDEAAPDVPAWVADSVRHWWASLRRMEIELTPRQDALKELDQTAGVLVTAFGRAMLFDNPQLRKDITSFAQSLHRRSRQHGTPPDLAQILAERSGQLFDLLRRTDPARQHRPDAPTPQTLAKLQRGDHLDRLAQAADLTPGQLDACHSIANIVEELTARLGIKSSDLQPEGRGKGGAGVRQPIETMSDDAIEYLQEVYMPWAERMHAVPWHVDLWRTGHQGDSRATAVNHRGGTYFTITRALVCEGLLPAQCDRHYRLPDGRAKLILQWALSAYPQSHRMSLDRFFS